MVIPRRALESGPWAAPVAAEPVHATVRLPGSKSETNRALVLAALSDGPSQIRNGLEARDTRLMRDALRVLGVTIDDSDAGVWRVTPPARFSGSGTIDCGLAGTVMRFVPPIAALTDGTVEFTGDAAAEVRPMGPLLDALYDLGVGLDPVQATGLPFRLTGTGEVAGGPLIVDASTSSQYISGLLLAGARYRNGIDIRHRGATTVPSRPNIDMTISMLRERGVHVELSAPDRWIVAPGPIRAKDVTIAPDLSNAAPFLAAGVITMGSVTVPDWPTVTDQPGDHIRRILTEFGSRVELTPAGLVVTGQYPLQGVDLDLHDCSELTPVVAALAAITPEPCRIRGVAHIRGHETDRLKALATELNQLGAHVREESDGLSFRPRVLHGGDFATYADHRMAHAGAVLGLIVDGVVLDDISCTSKTMTGFSALWDDMLDQSAEYAFGQSGADAQAQGQDS
ncbi:3-phosphoshikimate 1-carboxyvinyltransferase [Granulicoccus phenolivorans]|uniref:3-phosphoshikimate 1-carboxyvinyltransferase n=1 Tax=Granulicoccus phenolivorans TaxID=266854 RepID=UPI00041353C0|nr:3-phosphoshikimate 1-carboxyvinyltransferase [Granulicoccus phenolivorans]